MLRPSRLSVRGFPPQARKPARCCPCAPRQGLERGRHRGRASRARTPRRKELPPSCWHVLKMQSGAGYRQSSHFAFLPTRQGRGRSCRNMSTRPVCPKGAGTSWSASSLGVPMAGSSWMLPQARSPCWPCSQAWSMPRAEGMGVTKSNQAWVRPHRTHLGPAGKGGPWRSFGTAIPS